MKYIRFNGSSIVQEIIPEFVVEFPGVPITERYSKEFLSQCLEVADEVNVEQNWEYHPMENIFKPVPPPVIEALPEEPTVEPAPESEATNES